MNRNDATTQRVRDAVHLHGAVASWRLVVGLGALFLLATCQKDEENPYANLTWPTEIPNPETLPQNNFAWLHQKIFRPVCANSGCHDGTFEPEYRTISSTYNSLVYQPAISNDSAYTYTYRVLPGDADHSLLYARLTINIPNTSGIMPLEVDGESDWFANETLYIQKIHDWIEGGALDMFGNAPSLGNLEPQVSGFLAFPPGNTTTPYPRGTDPGVQPIEVPAAGVDLWFEFDDDSTAAASLAYNKIKVSTSQFDFDAAPEQDLVISGPILALNFSNTAGSFTHKASVDLSGYAVGSYLFVRAYVNDGDHAANTEIPSDGTGEPMLSYFTLLIVP